MDNFSNKKKKNIELFFIPSAKAKCLLPKKMMMMLSSVGQTRSPLTRPRTTDSSFQIFSCPFSRRPQHHHHHHRQCRCRQITGELSLDRIKWKKLSLPADHPHPLPALHPKEGNLKRFALCVCVRFGAKFNFGLYREPPPTR